MERDPAVAAMARANAAAAGVERVDRGAAGGLPRLPPAAGARAAGVQPPLRREARRADDLEALYADLGRMLKERCGGWTLWLLSGNPALTGALRLKASRRMPVSNGGIDCRWLRYEIR